MVRPQLQSCKTDYDKPVDKGEFVSPADHIKTAIDTICQISKVLRANSICHEEILAGALTDLSQELSTFYQKLPASSKYAKKRIRIDLRQLLH